MQPSTFPPPLTVHIADWIAEKAEQQRTLAHATPTELSAADPVERARFDGINDTRLRVLSMMDQGHSAAIELDNHYLAGGSYIGREAAGWFDSTLQTIHADRDALRSHSSTAPETAAYNQGALSVLDEFEPALQLGRDLAGGCHFHSPVPRRGIDPHEPDGSVFAVLIQTCADDITNAARTNPALAEQHQNVLTELERWHGDAHADTTPAPYLQPYDKPLPTQGVIDDETAGYTFDAPQLYTEHLPHTHQRDDVTLDHAQARTPQYEPPTYDQHPEPPTFSQHPDIAARSTAHGAEGIEHHRGIQR